VLVALQWVGSIATTDEHVPVLFCSWRSNRYIAFVLALSTMSQHLST
jgi:hypothetical protein